MLWRQNDYKKELAGFFDWASDIVNEQDIILVDFPKRKEYFYFKFPLQHGDKPKAIKRVPKGQRITFIMRKPSGRYNLGRSWVRIFASREIEVLENKSRIFQNPPLRWLLTDEEKKMALAVARDALNKFLSGGEYLELGYFSRLPDRFHLVADLDVAFWVKGYLRGSAVVEKDVFGEGIAKAALRASRDARFKPLVFDELSEARIEIAIISDLKLPLSAGELEKNMLYPEKGYLLKTGSTKGWYLPEVFNIKRFKNLEEFLGDLAEKKAKQNRNAYRTAEILVFEVDDFIESENHQRALKFWGPILLIKDEITPEFIEQRLRMAADWLCRMQEEDGNIPAVINPLTGRVVKQIDWPRFSFTSFALAKFGRAVNEERYVEAAEKSFLYLEKYLFGNNERVIIDYELTFAYFGQLALTLGKRKDALLTAEKIIAMVNSLTFEPITFAQIASYFKIIGRSDNRFSAYFEKLWQILKENFARNLNNGQPINLAYWAELVNTFSGVDPEFAQEVAEWLKRQQLSDGAFPWLSQKSNLSYGQTDLKYTRANGKIFEALALSAGRSQEAIKRVLIWLFNMQYNQENAFFIPEEIRPKVLGSFRESFLNDQAWIDAAGHVLLGGARLLKSKFV